jgi:hypothetical protein
MTPEDEIKTLEALSQRAVAFLLGVTPRSIRAYTDLRRNDDGSYDCREVIAFVKMKARPARTPLGDGELIATLLGHRSIVDGVLTR